MFEFSFSDKIDEKRLTVPVNRLLTLSLKIYAAAGIGHNDVIGIHICDKRLSAELNNQYRQINKPTDVLSWCFADEDDGWNMPENKGACFGEIAICDDICKSQAENNGWDYETELIRLTIHGIAHICGYDHQTPEDESVMLTFEKKILSEIGYNQIYL